LTHAELRSLAFAVLAAFIVILVFSACGTTGTRALPQFEAPLTKADFQNVRTTAYTHTESDHREFTNHNALGGELHAAGPGIRRAENVTRALAADDTEDVGIRRVSNPGTNLEPFSMEETTTTRVAKTTRVTKTTRGTKPTVEVTKKPKIGSAAADWARWPAGTTFRLLSTGQIYRVDDYGWALSGRNTIDLYMATPTEMNTWGARQEPIQVLQWGDPQESLRFLGPRQNYPHIKRMVLELEGRQQEAAALH
jgi:3D (Asp-Asp-Asp) domain-containing protein